MTLGFVNIKDYPGPGCQGRINVFQTVRNIFMYRRFGNPKFLRCLPHGRMIVYDVVGDRNRAFFNIFLQENPPARTFLHTYAGGGASMNGYPHCFQMKFFSKKRGEDSNEPRPENSLKGPLSVFSVVPFFRIL